VRKHIAFSVILFFTATDVLVQLGGEVASPDASAGCDLGGGKTITTAYSSPRMKGRKIYGALVPFGQVWHTGANGATTFVTNSDVVVGGASVPAGSYTLFTIPQNDKWTLIINKKTGEWGIPYTYQSDELVHIDMTVSQLPAKTENFSIAYENNGSDCTMHIDWETTRASVTAKAIADRPIVPQPVVARPITARSGSAQNVGPILTRIVLHTHTNDEDKDNDTGVFVEVKGNDGKDIAYIENAETSTSKDCGNPTSRHYCDGSPHDFDIPLKRNDIYESDCTKFTWRMGIQASGGLLPSGTVGVSIDGGPKLTIITFGNDKWKYDGIITLYFSDGTSFSGDKLDQTLESRGGNVVWDEYSGHNR
jgi:hypothetical protein